MKYQHSIVQQFLEINFDILPPVHSDKYTAEHVQIAKHHIYSDLISIRTVLTEPGHVVGFTKFTTIYSPTTIEKMAEIEAKVIFSTFTTTEKEQIVVAFLDACYEMDPGQLSHYEQLNRFFKDIYKCLKNQKIIQVMAGFKRIYEELESWSRSNDITAIGPAAFKYCIFFSLLIQIFREYIQKVIDKIVVVIEKPTLGNIDVMLISNLTLVLQIFHCAFYETFQLNLMPSLFVPSAMIYRAFKNDGQRRFRLSTNITAQLLTSSVPEEYLGFVKPRYKTLVIETPDVLWLNESFDLQHWQNASEKEKLKTLMSYRKKLPLRSAEFMDDVNVSTEGRRHIYVTLDNDGISAYYATERDIRNQLFCLRPVKKNTKVWTIAVNTLVYLNARPTIVREIGGCFQIGKDDKVPVTNIDKIVNKFRNWKPNSN